MRIDLAVLPNPDSASNGTAGADPGVLANICIPSDHCMPFDCNSGRQTRRRMHHGSCVNCGVAPRIVSISIPIPILPIPILQKALVNDAAVFGQLQKGSVDNPAVVKESVHHLFKYVSGKPLQRPAWFFDVAQQGEGIVDIATHLVDLIQWESFPEQLLSPGDVEMLRAERWPTIVTREQFKTITGLPDFPDYLRGKLNKDGALPYYSNGEMSYKLKGVNARISVTWNFEAPAGAGDTHFSVMKGSKANVIIRQGKEENYRPELFVEATDAANGATLEAALKNRLVALGNQYPGLELKNDGKQWHILIPAQHRKDHAAHFGQVLESFLQYLKAGRLPIWEVPNMITKYYTTTKALEFATGGMSSAER